MAHPPQHNSQQPQQAQQHQQEQHAQQQHKTAADTFFHGKAAARMAVRQNQAKPRWRGVLHSYACAAMLSAGAILVLEAQTSLARMSALVYVTAAAFQFFVSALYHTQHWGPGAHKLLMRIDHSAIYG